MSIDWRLTQDFKRWMPSSFNGTPVGTGVFSIGGMAMQTPAAKTLAYFTLR